MGHQRLLDRVAEARGIELEYTDAFGHLHHAKDEVTRALLSALGYPSATDAELERASEVEQLAAASQVVNPIIVVNDDHAALPLRVPKSIAGASIKLEIEWEGGELEHHWYWLPELPAWDPSEQGDGERVTKRLSLPRLRLGYHRLRILHIENSALTSLGNARFIVCPKRAKSVDRRLVGFGLNLYAVRSSRNWGCGDFTDLRAIIDRFAPAGAAFIGLNPLHAIANRQPYNTSPYLPECAFYRNFIYLDVERVAASHEIDSSHSIEWTDEMRAELEALRASEFVEYERVAQLKLSVLSSVFEKLHPSQDLERFIAEQGCPLADYATYCALYEHMRALYPDRWLWTEWPEEYRAPRSEAVRVFSERYHDRVRFFQFLQWQLSVQASETQAYAKAKGMEIGLYHDLALATDRYGCDLWANRPFYSTGCRVGAPPDELAPQGQDWGFPPPNRDAHRRDGYQLFAQSIRQAAYAGGALRIDHVMRFFRLFWIPEAFATNEGTYVRDYGDDLMGILRLESIRGDFIVVGEDLGTVTGEARAALATAGVLSYRLLWFEKDHQGNFIPPDRYPSEALASATTHDLPALAGFMLARDIEARKAAGLVDEAGYWQQKHAREEEIRKLRQSLEWAGFANNPLGFLLATPCMLAMINYEDLSGETEQQNLPASTWQHPNWRRKWRGTVEEVGPLADSFRELAMKSGRVAIQVEAHDSGAS